MRRILFISCQDISCPIKTSQIYLETVQIQLFTKVNGINLKSFYLQHLDCKLTYKNKSSFYSIENNLKLYYYAYFKAIGDTISLSVSTNRHLKKIGLIDNEDMTKGYLNRYISIK